MPRLPKIATTILVLICLWSPAAFAEEPETTDQGVVASFLESLQELLVIINQGVMLPPNGEPANQSGG